MASSDSASSSSPLNAHQIKILTACLKASLLCVARAEYAHERARVVQLFGRVGLFLANPGEFRDDACNSYDCGTVTSPPEWFEEWHAITAEMMDAWVAALSLSDLKEIIDSVLLHYRAAVEQGGANFSPADFAFAAEKEE